VVVTFDRGVDVTEAALEPPKSCADFAAKSLSFRRGLVASMALIAMQRLKESTRPAKEQWDKIGLCLIEGSKKAVEEIATSCKASATELRSIGPKASSDLALHCLPPR
jgi:hypothetical protein